MRQPSEARHPIGYPFSAVVGQETAKWALLLVAADVRLGGVLLRGERGAAKTTLARGLAALLPGRAPFVELPLGASEDRLVGGLDLGRVLERGEVGEQVGLLAAADGGVLYVDEVNLLPDHLVDLLLDAAASGHYRLERDGVSVAHASRFVLVGSMNPEEGELRPQLLDRFGLSVEVRGVSSLAERVDAVTRRLAFDADPQAVTVAHADDESRLREAIRAARVLLRGRGGSAPAWLVTAAARLAAEAGVDGLRSDLALVRAALARAALEGRSEPTRDDLTEVAPLVLGHRLRRSPLDVGGADPDALRRWAASLEVGQPADDPPAGKDRADGGPRSARQSEPGGERQEEGPRPLSPPASRPDAEEDAGAPPDDRRRGEASPDIPASAPPLPEPGRRPGDHEPEQAAPGAPTLGTERTRDTLGCTGADEAGVEGAADAVGPPWPPGDSPAVPTGATGGRVSGVEESSRPADGEPTAAAGHGPDDGHDRLHRRPTSPPERAATLPSPPDVRRPGLGVTPLGSIEDTRASDRHRAGPTRPSGHGRVLGGTVPLGGTGAGELAGGATITQAVRRGAEGGSGRPFALVRGDLRFVRRGEAPGRTVVVAMDASGSMGVERMAMARDAILRYLLDAYRRRDHVGLVAFHGEGARVLLAPTASVEVARARLENLPAGGRTPLSEGLRVAGEMAEKAEATGRRSLLVVVSDGRATFAPEGADPVEAALAEAERLRRAGVPSLVVDVETDPRPLRLGPELARALGGEHRPLRRLDADELCELLPGAGGAGSP